MADTVAKRTDDLPTDPEEKYKVTYIRSAQAFSRNDLENAIKFWNWRNSLNRGKPIPRTYGEPFTPASGIGPRPNRLLRRH